MRKHILLPGVALAGGAVGFALRRWELASAFEPGTGLPTSGAPATLTLIIWSAVILAVILFLCRDCREQLTFDQAFEAEGNTVYLAVSVLSGFLLLTSAGAELVEKFMLQRVIPDPFSQTPISMGGTSRLTLILQPLRVALCVLAFFCVLAIARNLYRKKNQGKDSLALLGLCLLFCIWLISDYQSRASDPILLDYAYSMFAILTALLGLYFLAGYSFQTGKPRRTTVFCLLGVYFSLVTLADSHTVAELLRYGFAVLFLTAHTVLLLRDHSAGTAPTNA